MRIAKTSAPRLRCSLVQIDVCKSLAGTPIIAAHLFGNSEATVKDTPRTRMALARKLRQFAKALEA
ncbi:MAG: hypothetical protein HIU84_11980 [Acidobacteria bacterium]|nr:hypothetical protein [Acidobacteriota bacterium]